MIWHPTRELLLSCSYDDTMKVWQDDSEDWVCTETIKGHASTVWDATFEPKKGDLLVSCSEDHSIILWRFSNPDSMPAPGDEISRFVRVAADTTTHPRTVYSVDWSHSNPQLIATGCADDAVRVFSVQGANEEGECSLKLEETVQKAHSSDVNCVRWHPSRPIFASGGDDGIVRIWSYQS